jgi:hypothetical protein
MCVQVREGERERDAQGSGEQLQGLASRLLPGGAGHAFAAPAPPAVLRVTAP